MSEDSSGAQPAYRTIRELASDDRPRERLLEHGASALSDAELIALILGSGTRGENVVDLARRVLETSGGLHGLTRATARTFLRTRGLGPAKAAQLSAAIELGRRVQRIEPEDRPYLYTPELAYQFLAGRFLGLTKEVLYVLSLDTRGRLLGAAIAVAGGINGVSSRAADVFREPVIVDATSVVIAHNHPSGDPQPSPQDVSVTTDLIAAGKLLGIEIEDHLIVGQGKYISMRAGKYIPGWRAGTGGAFGFPRPRKNRAAKPA